MIDEKSLAIELYLLPERQRRRLLSAIPGQFHERLQRYFEHFDLAGKTAKDVSSSSLPSPSNSYPRTARFAELLPGASAEFIGRFGRLLDGEEDIFPPAMAQALCDFGAAVGEGDR